MYSNDDQDEVYQNCKCQDPRGRGWQFAIRRGLSHLVKMHYFFKNLLHLYFEQKSDKLSIKEGSFHSYGDVTIAGEGLQILTYARHSWTLSSEGSLV